MTLAALGLVAVAAVMHASWNALAKRATDQLALLWWASLVSSLVFAVPAAWVLARDGVRLAALPFVVATILLHAVYFYTLARAYAAGAYTVVYPVARGLGVALVPVIAWIVFEERISGHGALGIALVVIGIAAVNLVALPQGAEAPPAALRSGTGWAVLTGLTIASYSLVDKAGVARMDPIPYLALMEAGCVLCMWPAARRRPGALEREWRTNRRAVVAVGIMSGLAYVLVLFAFQLSKAGYVVAARELAIVFSALIGGLWLGEGRVARRLAAASLVVAGVALVALAR